MKTIQDNKLKFSRTVIVELDNENLLNVNGGTSSSSNVYIHGNGDVYVGDDTKISDKVN